MKKYLMRLLLLIYPYIYVLFLIIDGFVLGRFGEELADAMLTALMIYHVLVLVTAVGGAVEINRKKYSASDAAKVNMVIKFGQIPAYILHFVIGVIGFLLGIWGILILLYAVIVDLVAIALSGTHALGCVIKMRRENFLSTLWTVLAVIGSYIYVVDVIVAGALIYHCDRMEYGPTGKRTQTE